MVRAFMIIMDEYFFHFLSFMNIMNKAEQVKQLVEEYMYII